jgi:hypothetical protein
MYSPTIFEVGKELTVGRRFDGTLGGEEMSGVGGKLGVDGTRCMSLNKR